MCVCVCVYVYTYIHIYPVKVRLFAPSGTHADGDSSLRVPSRPGALLLHTGNIGKMPDATVHPEMRRLGSDLQVFNNCL